MLFTDMLNDVRVDPLVNTDQRISAQNVHVIHFDQSVAELFVLNCSLCVTPLPQNMCAFPENGNAGVARLCSLSRSLNEVAEAIHKPCRIEHAVDDKNTACPLPSHNAA